MTVVHKRSFRFSGIDVIESLADGDYKTGTALYETELAPLCAKLGISVRLHRPTTRAEFLAVFEQLTREASNGERGPIVHIEVHGDKEGIQLANDERLKWGELVGVLTALNEALRLNLFVVLAACEGAYIRQVLHPLKPAPVWAVVGPKQVVKGVAIRTGFRAFYEEFLKSFDGMAALRALNGTAEIKEWGFDFETAELLFMKVYALHLERSRDPALRKARIDRLIEKLKADRNVTATQETELREKFEREVKEPRDEFDEHRAAFFMLDKFSENTERFPITFDDCANHRVTPQPE